jgi:hypothetical protein
VQTKENEMKQLRVLTIDGVSEGSTPFSDAPSRRKLLVGAVAIGSVAMFGPTAFGSDVSEKASSLTVWKSATCGCCGGWADYMRAKGYQVSVNVVRDPDAIKVSLGVPEALYSCHTAQIGGYLIEGHVPEKAIAKLLEEKPDLKGIALPGMPSGSPGMDGTPSVYRVVGFGANGRLSRFAEVGV